ncbi:hypothetical protein [Pedobacter punctiformis]|uniref:Uncharacterized protein n=1 Tax=Pedobacter punctiformis TaxID=3004097 RepID=A0ABT4LAM5_9SPHI|nr:hypothetical protein [Pedobacter sp. HCMS5-2]MCZ4244977.1 hypothetical protein [Pedobacter sp. HCMS5-2]
MIKITADFSLQDLNDIINDETESWFDELVDDYRRAGKQFVERAVAKATFNNITWNLRSSIGYLIMFEGKIVESYFKDLKDGTEGQEVGRDYAEFVARLVNDGVGLAMALVAGEEYAYFVEKKGKDVISGSYSFFETDLKSALQ